MFNFKEIVYNFLSSSIYIHYMQEIIEDSLLTLNAAKAIDSLGDESIFNEMLENIMVSTLQPSLEKLKQAMDTFDFKEIRMISHTIKGTIAYIGAERLRRASEIVQFNVDKQQGPNIYRNYPLIIEESIKVKTEVRRYKILKKLDEGITEFKESDEDFKVPISKFYKLDKKTSTDFKIVQIAFPDIPPVPFLDIMNKKPTTTQLKKEENKCQNANEQKQAKTNNNLQARNEQANTAPNISSGSAEVKKKENKIESTKEITVEVKEENKKLSKKPSEPQEKNESEQKEKKETTGCSCSLL